LSRIDYEDEDEDDYEDEDEAKVVQTPLAVSLRLGETERPVFPP
jgi:hypothetical protein